MNKQEETRKCTACKIDRPLNHYVSKAGRTNLKNCERCRNIKSKKIDPDRCLHAKVTCRICGGPGRCLHNNMKAICKLCNNPKKLVISKMISNSKQSDIYYNRYNANKFIDKCFIEMLMDESMQCHYCKCEMHLMEKNDTKCTIERLDNSIGHIKSNCVLACQKCNFSKNKRLKKS